MRTDTPPLISRQDYQAFGYQLLHAQLDFDLDHSRTCVRSELQFEHIPGRPRELVLDGEELELVELRINGQIVDESCYTLSDDRLILDPRSDRFTISIISICRPQENTALMGLYASGDKLFTQCEAEGFRRITWFPDRPDVLTTYTVSLRAHAQRYPVLLSNGNLIRTQQLADGRHEAVWEDPHPKPSYLFALVAGHFDCREESITTHSGREVLLQVYSDAGTRAQTAWALECLKRALRWDESVYGLELDLDRFMIVATRDFNMGAMENKGLNIFNATYVLADPDIATDTQYRMIEAVIGHEYFHNWTGNRVTCRDWFQLSLKEGLTVFREQEFSADMRASGLAGPAALSARAVKRIEDVTILRNSQFPEDAGPMAHPIRPEHYREISNFYTATIYEKGAEIIRMLHTLLGTEVFHAGMAEYFRRHDGKAVTCDDFLDAMEAAWQHAEPGRSLEAFRQWYSQAGTPRIHVRLEHDDLRGQTVLHVRQSNPPAGSERQRPGLRKPPLHIPFMMGFITAEGMAIQPERLVGQGDTPDCRKLPDGSYLLELTKAEHQWTCEHGGSRPIPSLLRSFSAPVIVEHDYSDNDLMALARHDPDLFARWEALQGLSARAIRQALASPDHDDTTRALDTMTAVWQTVLHDPSLTPDYLAHALALIPRTQLLSEMRPMDPHALDRAYRHAQSLLGRRLANDWLTMYKSLDDVHQQTYKPNPRDAGKRALRLLALDYLMAGTDANAMDMVRQHYELAGNLTDRIGALRAIASHGRTTDIAPLLDDFHQRAQRDAQLMDHWFSIQASASWATVEVVRELMRHPEFSLRNPNRARSVIFQFCLHNPSAFHNAEGYDFWAEMVLALDALNPEVAARLARGLENWSSFVEPLRTGLEAAIRKIHQHPGLSPNVYEIADNALSLAGLPTHGEQQ